MKGLNSRTVIVTGGGGGIGQAVCKRFAEHGARVAVLDRDENAAQATVDVITKAGGEARAAVEQRRHDARSPPDSRRRRGSFRRRFATRRERCSPGTPAR